RGKHAGRPDERRGDVGNLKWQLAHAADPCDQRHDAAKRTEEASAKDADGAPLLEDGMAPRQKLRVPGQRPETRDRILVVEAEPVGEPVAADRTKHGSDPDRPE